MKAIDWLGATDDEEEGWMEETWWWHKGEYREPRKFVHKPAPKWPGPVPVFKHQCWLLWCKKHPELGGNPEALRTSIHMPCVRWLCILWSSITIHVFYFLISV